MRLLAKTKIVCIGQSWESDTKVVGVLATKGVKANKSGKIQVLERSVSKVTELQKRPLTSFSTTISPTL